MTFTKRLADGSTLSLVTTSHNMPAEGLGAKRASPSLSSSIKGLMAEEGVARNLPDPTDGTVTSGSGTGNDSINEATTSKVRRLLADSRITRWIDLRKDLLYQHPLSRAKATENPSRTRMSTTSVMMTTLMMRTLMMTILSLV